MQTTTTPLKVKVSVPEHIHQELIEKKEDLILALCIHCGGPMRLKELKKDVPCPDCERVKIMLDKTGEF